LASKEEEQEEEQDMDPKSRKSKVTLSEEKELKAVVSNIGKKRTEASFKRGSRSI